MIRSLYALALYVLMEKYSCKELRQSNLSEVLEIRKNMINNIKFSINYRDSECCNQLHYYTDTPGIVLTKIDEGNELYEIGMSNVDF